MLKMFAVTAAVIVFDVCLALLWRRLRPRHARWLTAIRILLGVALLAVYIYGVLSMTILGRTTGAQRKAELELFWSHRESFSFVDGELKVTSMSLLIEIVLNVMLFIPTGAILPFLLPNIFMSDSFPRDLLRIGIVGALSSLAIELTQWLFRLGLFEFDDVVDNALGALVGYILYRLVARPRRVVLPRRQDPAR